jgi:hypothetical protein
MADAMDLKDCVQEVRSAKARNLGDFACAWICDCLAWKYSFRVRCGRAAQSFVAVRLNRVGIGL